MVDRDFIKFKVQCSMFKVKTNDFRALTVITLFLLALLFSLPNLVIAIALMILISALLEIIRMLAEWQPKKLPKEGTAHLLATWVYRKYIRRGSNDSHNNSYHSFTKLKYRRDGLARDKDKSIWITII